MNKPKTNMGVVFLVIILGLSLAWVFSPTFRYNLRQIINLH